MANKFLQSSLNNFSKDLCKEHSVAFDQIWLSGFGDMLFKTIVLNNGSFWLGNILRQRDNLKNPDKIILAYFTSKISKLYGVWLWI